MKTIIIFLFFCSQFVHASVRVALFRAYDQKGSLIQIEPGGQFFHAAVQLRDGRWIHTNPHRGVEAVKDLEEIGRDRVVLINPRLEGLTAEQVQPYLGLPFDFKYNWDDPNSSFCAKLIANLLGIRPRPAQFSAPFWERRKHPAVNSMSLSADDLFEILPKNGFLQESDNCQSDLMTPFMVEIRSIK